MDERKEQLSCLNQMSKRSVALYHRYARAIGVSDSALGVLYALLEAPCSQLDLCGAWSIPKQTVNTAVAALQKKGLVSLSPVPGTKNKKCIALTDAGRAFAQATVGRLRDAELDALSALTAEERTLFVRLNRKYNDVLADRLEGFLPETDGRDEGERGCCC